jgi:exonuclease III
VGILIKNSLDFEYLDRRESADENILALRCKVNSTELLLVSIYGPNAADPNFFISLREYLAEFNDIPIVCGGDWNATFCINNVPENIDCLNMARPPNIGHSQKIHEICDTFSLTDPYRHLYPDTREFTYVPRYAGAMNKSRIDFFLISDSICDHVFDCTISSGLQNKLFDHKVISCMFNKKKN